MRRIPLVYCLLFFFNDTATTEIYTLSLHDALPIWLDRARPSRSRPGCRSAPRCDRSEEHTSELQSRFGISYAVFCLKKKNIKTKEHQQRTLPHSIRVRQHHGCL